MISIPVDPALETQVADVLERTGLTTEVAVRMLFAHLAAHGPMPPGLTPPGVVISSAVPDTAAADPSGRARADSRVDPDG